MTPLEINSTTLLSDANLQGYWRLSADGTDSGPNGYTLTASGLPVYAAGKFGNGVDLENTKDANLQGLWRFDNDATDSSANGYNLTAVNSPTYTTGKFEAAADLEADSTQYFHTTTTTNLNVTTSQTWMFWVKPESITGWHCMATLDTVAVNNRLFRYNSSGILVGSITGLSASATSDAAITTGSWFHCVFRYDSSAGTFDTFVNGAKKSTNVTGTITASTPERLTIGIADDLATQMHDGLVDEVAMFNRALSDAEVTAAYTYGLYRQRLVIANASCAGLGMTGSRTITAWVKPEADPATLASNSAIVTKMHASDGYRGYSLSIQNVTGYPVFQIFALGGANTQHWVSTAVPVGTWSFIAGRYDATAGTFSVFLNGAKSSTTASGTSTDNADNFAIGCSHSNTGNTPSHPFDGMIDDVAVFDRALTDAEMYYLYVGETPSASYIKPKSRMLLQSQKNGVTIEGSKNTIIV